MTEKAWYDKEIRRLQNRLYYINNKESVNNNRKKYKRQTWLERKDNKGSTQLVKELEEPESGFERMILDSISLDPKSTGELWKAFKDKEWTYNSLRGRISDLKRRGRIKKEDGKWWVL